MKLAENLQRHYAGQFEGIAIFDSREAWQIDRKWREVVAEQLVGGRKETPEDRALGKQVEQQRDEHVLVLILPPETAAEVGLEEIRWVKGGLTRKRRAEKARKEAEEKTREARAEERKKSEQEARKKAAQQKDEEWAASNLKYAQKLAITGEVEKAKERLRWIIKELPNTKAAKEAKDYLDVLKDTTG